VRAPQSGAPAVAMHTALPYRPDIDGLRAVAVIMVIACHAFPGLLPGGFTGVDVFFVISGYLITGLVLAEMRAGGFTLLGFYAVARGVSLVRPFAPVERAAPR
jgi:peptidoglycan/LPS O-acetylase OafA/YrhL